MQYTILSGHLHCTSKDLFEINVKLGVVIIQPAFKGSITANVHIRRFHETYKHVRWKHDQKENIGCHKRTDHFLSSF